MTTPTDGSLGSVAFRDIRAPDFADAAFAVLPDGATTDPAEWARAVFDRRSVPLWVGAAVVLRQLLVPVLGIPRPPADVFAVRESAGREALLGWNDRHLDFRVGVGVDAGPGLVRVVSTVRLKGWRGRLYFAPVRLLHPWVVQSMLRRASRRLGARAGAGRRRRGAARVPRSDGQ